MKTNFLNIVLAALSVVAVSCVKDARTLDDADGTGIILTVSTTDAAVMPTVKSLPNPRNGEDEYNENLLNSIYYFFYPKDVLDSAPAVSGFVSGIAETGLYTREIPVSSNTINNVLFAADRECQLFVVANPTPDIESALAGTPTLAQLRAMTVLSSLKTVPQDNFLMVYDGPVSVTSRTQDVAIQAEVALKRLACKFTVGAFVTQSIEKAGKTYTPVLTGKGLSVTFCNAINRTTLSGFDQAEVVDDDYFNSTSVDVGYVGTSDLSEGGEDVTYHKYSSSVPIYTYPMEWEFASTYEPYLLYDLTWEVTDSSTGSKEFKNLYYKLTLGRRSVFSNEWYNIAAKLTVLGSLYPDDPKQVFPYMNYQVAGWNSAYVDGQDPNTPAVISDTRYLVVPQTDWVLNNKDVVTIPFSTSHPCEVSGLTASKTDFSSGSHRTVNVNSSVSYELDPTGSISVTRVLNNDLASGDSMDVSPVSITFTLRHADDSNFAQTISIVQYPAIFVDTQCNTTGPTGTTNKGYTYVNGTQSGDTWLTVLGANASGANSSHYHTVITVSQFDAVTGYVVGDPRDPEINNLGSTRALPWTGTGNYAPVSAPAKYDKDGQTGNRTIKYYYPTIDDGSRDNFVAPSLRIGTGHCRSGRNDAYADIKKRCASYQEDGYPAGRWRIPTLAECKLCQTLSNNGLIPNIFYNGNSYYYFYAGGYFSSTNYRIGDTSHAAAVRCVYDEWYWSAVDEEFGWDNGGEYGGTINTAVKTTFTWGDLPRNYVHNN